MDTQLNELDEKIIDLIEKIDEKKESKREDEIVTNTGLSHGTPSVFRNPYADMAMTKMTDEEKEKYKRVGKVLYEGYDYENMGDNSLVEKRDETNKEEKKEEEKKEEEKKEEVQQAGNTNDNEAELALTEATAYILEGVKSGLHPFYLEQHEKDTLRLQLGSLWMEDYGFTLEEVEQGPSWGKVKKL